MKLLINNLAACLRSSWRIGARQINLTEDWFAFLKPSIIWSIRCHCLLLFYLPLSLYSQTSPTLVPAIHHELLEEIPKGVMVFDVVIDTSGFMWIGTDNGLYRYDGYQVQSFKASARDSTTLVTNYVGCMKLDQSNNLWIGTTGNGFGHFNTHTFQYISYESLTEGTCLKSIMSMLPLSNGKLLLSSRSCIQQFDPIQQTFIELDINHPTGNPRKLGVIEMMEDSEKEIWMMFLNSLGNYNSETNKIEFHIPPFKYPFYAVHQIVEKDKETLLLPVSNAGLFSFDKTSKNWQQLYTQPTYGLAHDARNDVNWISEPNRLVFNNPTTRDYVPITTNTLKNKEEIAGNLGIKLDQAGNLWGYGKKGIGKFKTDLPIKHFKIIRDLDNRDAGIEEADNYVRSIWKAKEEENLWLLTSHNIFKWNQQTTELQDYKDLKLINDFPEAIFYLSHVDKNGNLWVGGFDSKTKRNQLFRFNLTAGNYINFSNSKTSQDKQAYRNGRVIDFASNNQSVWISTYSGVQEYDLQQEQFIPIPVLDTLLNKAVNALLLIREDLWIGTADLGLYRYDITNKTLYAIDDEAAAFGSSIETLAQGDDKIWIGTSSGLYYYDINKEVYKKIEDFPQLSNRTIFKMFQESPNRYWLSTIEGWLYYDTANETLKDYGQTYALDGNLINDMHQDDNQMLWFAAQNGLYQFNAKTSFQNKVADKQTNIEILEIATIDNGNAASTFVWTSPTQENIRLGYASNSLKLKYTALDFTNPTENEYQYIMEGLQENWQQVGKQNEAYFTKLPAGDYTFKVKGTNGRGEWSDKIAQLSITILPPWYWNLWSKIVYGLLIGGLVYTFYQFLLNRRLAEAETQRLLELDQVKTQLYTNITHEFRTPLTVIQGMAEQIKQTQYAQETQLIRRNSKNLLQLINQLLDLSKLEAGKLQLDMIQGDIIPYLRYVSESFQSFAAHKNINFSFKTVPTELVMDYDEEKILNILSNLLFNAIKFTPENGQVALSVEVIETDKKYLQIFVKDTGIGISAKQLPFIFDRFYQVESGNTRKQTGTGIGLSITYELVQLLKGQLEVKSQLNQGAIFEMTLPITNLAALETKIYESKISSLSLPEQSLATVTETANLIAEKEQPLLLLIEDNEDVLYYLIACLKGNYRIVTAINGEQGVQTAMEQIPDLIISDVMMPEMDGYEVCTALKEKETTSHIPIILLTAKVDQASKLEGFRQGADAYLPKPFNQEELATRILQLLKQRQQLKTYYSQLDTETTQTQVQDPFIQKVIDLVEKDLVMDLPPAKLAQLLTISQSQVYRKIKGVTGYSTTIFIRRIRLKNAHRLLKTTGLSISEICYATGFNDPAFFSRSFSEVFGQAPSEFRQKLKDK